MIVHAAPFSPELSEKLARLHNRRSRYELVMSHPDGRRYLVAYAARRSRGGLLDALRHRHESVCKVAGRDWIEFAKKAGDGGMMGEWSVRFSGRRQRQAYIEGELPYVGRVAKELA